MIKIRDASIIKLSIDRFDNIPVTEGRLYLIRVSNTEATGLSKRRDNGKMMLYPSTEKDHKEAIYLLPIITSTDDDFEVGDKVLSHSKILTISAIEDENCKVEEYGDKWMRKLFHHKILALPEHFSADHLDMIVNGKLKDGDKINIECTWVCKSKDCNGWCDQKNISCGDRQHIVRLNPNNNINIFHIEDLIWNEFWDNARKIDIQGDAKESLRLKSIYKIVKR